MLIRGGHHDQGLQYRCSFEPASGDTPMKRMVAATIERLSEVVYWLAGALAALVVAIGLFLTLETKGVGPLIIFGMAAFAIVLIGRTLRHVLSRK